MTTRRTTMSNKAKASSVASWKAKSQGTPLTVPSGQTALVKLPGLQVFLEEGIIPNSLLPLVTESLSKGIAPSQRQLQDNMDLDKVRDMMSLFDAVTVYCVVEPKVYPIPPADKERDEELLYVDEIDFDDKMFIFQFAIGGTREVETFRKEHEAYVADVSDDESDVVSPE